jgi:predicted small lipoprotein YifL
MKVLLAGVLLLFTAGLAGCGQKGPLYLPPSPPHHRLPAPATHPRPDAIHVRR